MLTSNDHWYVDIEITFCGPITDIISQQSGIISYILFHDFLDTINSRKRYACSSDSLHFVLLSFHNIQVFQMCRQSTTITK